MSAVQENVAFEGPLPEGSGKAAFVLTGIAFLAFLMFVFVYARWGGLWVDALPGEIGEVMADEAARLAQAGETDAAIVLYQRALESRFDHVSRRTRTLKDLGALLAARGDWNAALPYLRDAYALPDPPLSLYPVLCNTLLKTSNASEAVEVARRWRQLAELQQQPQEADRARAVEEQARGTAENLRGKPSGQ